jgi:hypothetical protein
MTRLLIFALALAVIGPGCRPFGTANTPAGDPARPSPLLGSNRAKTGTVTLEIAVVSIPRDLMDRFESVWAHADVQFVDYRTRRMLDRNGIRCGTLGTRLPGELTGLLVWTPPMIDGEIAEDARSLQAFDAGSRVRAQLQQLQPGTQHWVACSAMHPSLNWFTLNEDQRRTGICFHAHCGMTVGLVSADDGGVQLRLHPEILHGQRRMRYGIDEDDFLLEPRQDRLPLRDLNFGCRLLPGQTLMIACTPDLLYPPPPSPEEEELESLPEIDDAALWSGEDAGELAEALPLPFEAGPLVAGSAFFGNRPDGTGEGRFLLIRPVFVEADDLFQSGTTHRRLSTSLE